MSFSINTNIGAVAANLNSQNMDSSLGRLSTGLQINSAADNSSGMAIANQLSAQISGMGQSIMNANESIGMIQIANSAMTGINENMDRIRMLTLKASNGIMNSSNRAVIQKEIDALMRSSGDILSQTSYNGMQLLGKGSSLSEKAGNLSLESIDVTSDTGLSSALNLIDTIQTSISEARSELGSRQNQLTSEIRNTHVGQVNSAAAKSQIRDLDFAAESANFSKQNIMSQMGSFTQVQANAVAANVTRLFG